MRKKGIKSVTEQQLFMLIRFWANDEMYEEPDVAPTKTSKVVSTPSKETTKPRKGISATQRAAGIADLFKYVHSSWRMVYKILMSTCHVISFEAAAKRREKEGVDALDIPSGQDNCLSGLTIVFTGELEKMSRDESTELAKRLGA
jgi:BRCT domain type II-containing protein